MKRALFAAALCAASILLGAPAQARLGLEGGQCVNKFVAPVDRIKYCKLYVDDGAGSSGFDFDNGNFALAYAYRIAGDYADAETTMTLVLNDIPYWENALMERSTAYAEDGKYNLALADVEKLAAMSGDDQGLPDMQRCWVRGVAGKELDAALADCGNAAALYPKDFAVLLARALVNFKRGDMKAAIADCDEAHAAKPKAASALFLRGVAKGADGAGDISDARDDDEWIADEFAGYGVKPATPSGAQP
jgi:tetratricopeptide (TPR) repeat protein